MFAFASTAAYSHHWEMNTPEYYHCDPGLERSISGDTLFYDPLISVDCPLFFGAALSYFYELMAVDIEIQHQRKVNGVWQAGSNNYQYHYSNWDLSATDQLIWDHYQIGGGVTVKYRNTTHDRYRLIVTLKGATTHQPFATGYEVSFKSYLSGWVYGLNPVRVRDEFDDRPDELTSGGDTTEAATCELVGHEDGTWYCKAPTGDLASEACEVTTGVPSDACSTQPDGGVECACVF